ncbi:MAG: pyridoxamine 5'-phosphate oxidase [Rhizobiales bacterium 62-17]|nr:pyridoxal 5'-phosphate synthase [Hyphomicrobiales bacterium]OJY01106.1 MAG: pyridoxamine 5'-phosphate oxidase [Rhizobiales bacterium 62-17]
MRDKLRALKSLAGPYTPFDPSTAPDDPTDLFAQWLQMAIDAGLREPHAMTLSTVDEKGFADARVLILKNVDEHGWHFAITKSSPKGKQIAANPNVALTFYWPTLGRQVCIRGVACDMGAAVRDADFLARPVGSRAGALLERQSDVLDDESELDNGLEQQRQRIAADPQLVSTNWAVYAVKPAEIEFWQGNEERRHVRLNYRRDGHTWLRERLWP